MFQCDSLILGIVIGILLCYLSSNTSESLVSKPTTTEQHKMATAIMANTSVFHNGTLDKARDVFEWMDAVLYEDLRKLAHYNQLTHSNIMKVLT